jgi:hypothetical protein
MREASFEYAELPPGDAGGRRVACSTLAWVKLDGGWQPGLIRLWVKAAGPGQPWLLQVDHEAAWVGRGRRALSTFVYDPRFVRPFPFPLPPED